MLSSLSAPRLPPRADSFARGMPMDCEGPQTNEPPTSRLPTTPIEIPTTTLQQGATFASRDQHPTHCCTSPTTRREPGSRRDLRRREGGAPRGTRRRPPRTGWVEHGALRCLLLGAAVVVLVGTGVVVEAFPSRTWRRHSLPTPGPRSTTYGLELPSPNPLAARRGETGASSGSGGCVEFPSRGGSGSSDTSMKASAGTGTTNSPPPAEPSPPVEAVWDPERLIYVGGVVPEHESVQELLRDSNTGDGGLSVFGYGSLCWNPGQDGDAVLSHPSVTTSLGRAGNYRRCWAQRSSDHRGTPDFPGIVCTLLKGDEVQPLLSLRRRRRPRSSVATMRHGSSIDMETLGRVYHVPSELVEPCLKELDYREKGGYARDVIDVRLEDGRASGQEPEDVRSSMTSNDVRALLYRGTLDNPAMWLRPLQDLTFAAAIMSVAVGPSGENLEYLERLDAFLGPNGAHECDDGSDDTTALAKLARQLRDNYDLFFLWGAGSNQHNQLMLRGTPCVTEETVLDVEDGHAGDDEIHGLTELVAACVPQQVAGKRDNGPDLAVDVLAGGGHTGILTLSGRLFLVGWNESGQLGRQPVKGADASGSNDPEEGFGVPLPIVLQELPSVRVEAASLGFSHTLVVEMGTGRLFGFGSNEKGQIHGWSRKELERRSPGVVAPTVPLWAASTDDRFVSVAAGVFHSAAVTAQGELCLWGCPRAIGLDVSSPSAANGVLRWKPHDGSRVVKVACGRRHTVAVDDRNRVWTLGDDRYGQLGRRTKDDANQKTPQLIELDSSMPPSSYRIESVSCGWSHTVILTKVIGPGSDKELIRVYGWGRNDRGQLGTGSTEDVPLPQQLFIAHRVQSVACGSEFTAAVCANGKVWSCGWNEHGNLATGDSRDRVELAPAVGVGLGGFSSTIHIGRPPAYPDGSPIRIAAGGSQLVAMRVASQTSP